MKTGAASSRFATPLPAPLLTCIGRLSKLKKHFNPRRRAQMLSAVLSDETGVLSLFWYRAPGYLVERLPEGARLLVHGKVESDSARR